MPETTTARYTVERALTRDEYWYVKRGNELVALFEKRRDADEYAAWKNSLGVKPSSNGRYTN